MIDEKCVKEQERLGMKVIIINGSPRKNWNTDKALQKAAEGAAATGADVETI